MFWPLWLHVSDHNYIASTKKLISSQNKNAVRAVTWNVFSHIKVLLHQSISNVIVLTENIFFFRFIFRNRSYFPRFCRLRRRVKLIKTQMFHSNNVFINWTWFISSAILLEKFSKCQNTHLYLFFLHKVKKHNWRSIMFFYFTVNCFQ